MINRKKNIPIVDHKKNLVVKANALIEASYRLSLAEQRIMLHAIVAARETQKGIDANSFITIKAADYADVYGLPHKQAYEQLKEVAKTIFSREFTICGINEKTGGEKIITSRWLAATSYADKEGTIELMFSGVVVPYITRLEVEFTRYKLGQIANMTSAHAIRMYELLIQWGSVGKREVDIEWLKRTLELGDGYERIDHFKKRVIDVGVAQINKHSDITAQYTQRKTGRNVTHLTFTFGPKPMPKPAPKPKQAAEDGVPRTYYERKKYIEKHARPGEGWNEAASRLGVKYP